MDPQLLCSHFDALGNAVLLEQLKQIKTRTYDYRYPELKARTLIPVSNEINPGASVMEWRSYDSVGAVKLLSAYAKDLPRSDIRAEVNLTPIRSLGGAYGYNIDEMAAAVFRGEPLDAKKAAAVRKSYEVEIDRLAALKDAKSNLLGLLNQPNAITHTIPNGAAGTATWATKTGPEIIEDMLGILSTIKTTTKSVERADTILIPSDQYGLIQTTMYEDDSDFTVLEFFRRISPGIEVIEWDRCNGAGTGGADRMVAYRRSPEYLELQIPKELTALPPQEIVLEVVVNHHARFGGVTVYVPYSMAYGDGV